MFFVWSWWYVVIAVLVAAIVALSVVLVKMDKRDAEIIKEFQEANGIEEEVKEEPQPKVVKVKDKE